MEGPKYDEIRRNNRSEIKKQEHEEELHERLQEDGISCDDCGEVMGVKISGARVVEVFKNENKVIYDRENDKNSNE